MSADQPPGTDCNGDPCPSWCTGTHMTKAMTVHHGEHHSVESPDGFTGPTSTWLSAAATQTTTSWRGSDPPCVVLYGDSYKGPHALAHVPSAEAANMAAIIEMLGAASPEQHRELAEAIRQVAAEITGPEPEPEAGS